MGLQDFIITPLLIVVSIILFYSYKKSWCMRGTEKYFLPALFTKFAGMIALGLIYQYYYNGGDTYNYYYWGSTWVYEAFKDSPILAFKLLFSDSSEYDSELFTYTSHMVFYGSGGADFISRLAGFFAIITSNTYLGISFFFAIISFSGGWYLFQQLQCLYPNLKTKLFLAIFCIPSTVIWGSGILKDTVILGSICLAFGSIISMLEWNRFGLKTIFLLVTSLCLIYLTKIYILFCVLPSFIIYFYFSFQTKIRQKVLKVIITPLLLIIVGMSSYFAVNMLPGEGSKYSITRLERTARDAAHWHDYVSNSYDGSGYSFGDYDYSSQGLLTKVLPAINVTLFRPYPWESNSIFMLNSSLESLVLLLLTLNIVLKFRLRLVRIFYESPLLLSMLIFCISLAFSLGAVTYNFGALVRYKIPILPIYLVMLTLIFYEFKRRGNMKNFVFN